MDDVERAQRRDDPVESGALEGDPEESREAPPRHRDQPIESGGLEEEPEGESG